MPRVTRAAYRSSQHTDTRPVGDRAHAKDSATSRADRHSSHNSSESLESGRDRRRRGKLRMQERIDSLSAQLTSANSRVSDLEAQSCTLIAIINNLAPSNANHATPPVLFDVFDLAEDVATVGCQTDISVPHQHQDRFCVVDPASNLVPCQSTAMGILAHAVDEPQQTQCGPLNTGASQEVDEPLVTGQRQALDGDHSEHRCLSGNGNAFQEDPLGLPQFADINYRLQNLKSISQEADAAAGYKSVGSYVSGSTAADLVSQDASEPLVGHAKLCISWPLDTVASQEADEPNVMGQQQALEGDNSEHCCPSGNGTTVQDDSVVQPQSQFAAIHYRLRNLTSISQDAATGYKSPVFETTAADCVSQDAPGFHCAQHKLDVGNARLCVSKPLDTGASQEEDDPLATGQRQALDGDHSEHRCASGHGITFQDDPLVQPQFDAFHYRLRNLTNVSQDQTAAAGYKNHSPVGDRAHGSFGLESTAADHVTQDALTSISQGRDAATGYKGDTSFVFESTSADLVSQDAPGLALPAEPLPAEFQRMFDHILSVFVQLREPTSSTIQATAKAIVQCAKYYSVAFVGISAIVHDKSEVLGRAFVQLWHDLK